MARKERAARRDDAAVRDQTDRSLPIQVVYRIWQKLVELRCYSAQFLVGEIMLLRPWVALLFMAFALLPGAFVVQMTFARPALTLSSQPVHSTFLSTFSRYSSLFGRPDSPKPNSLSTNLNWK